MQGRVVSKRVRTVVTGVLGLLLPLAAGIIEAAPSSTPPAWVAGITPGNWAAISRNTMSDVDPAKDPAVNPN